MIKWVGVWALDGERMPLSAEVLLHMLPNAQGNNELERSCVYSLIIDHIQMNKAPKMSAVPGEHRAS